MSSSRIDLKALYQEVEALDAQRIQLAQRRSAARSQSLIEKIEAEQLVLLRQLGALQERLELQQTALQKQLAEEQDILIRLSLVGTYQLSKFFRAFSDQHKLEVFCTGLNFDKNTQNKLIADWKLWKNWPYSPTRWFECYQSSEASCQTAAKNALSTQNKTIEKLTNNAHTLSKKLRNLKQVRTAVASYNYRACVDLSAGSAKIVGSAAEDWRRFSGLRPQIKSNGGSLTNTSSYDDTSLQRLFARMANKTTENRAAQANLINYFNTQFRQSGLFGTLSRTFNALTDGKFCLTGGDPNRVGPSNQSSISIEIENGRIIVIETLAIHALIRQDSIIQKASLEGPLSVMQCRWVITLDSNNVPATFLSDLSCDHYDPQMAAILDRRNSIEQISQNCTRFFTRTAPGLKENPVIEEKYRLETAAAA